MSSRTVFIVDDDPSVRDAVSLLLSLHGMPTQLYSSAEDFLTAYRESWNGCLLLDLKMPGMSGLQLQERLTQKKSRLKVVMVTAHGDVATARAALKAGATDFLEKPVDNDVLLDVVRNALGSGALEPEPLTPADAWRQRVATLTLRERQVLDFLVQGRQNREIGAELNISPRTVEVYRARMMEKLRVGNLAELIRAHTQATEAVA